MAVYKKIEGAWQRADLPYLKVGEIFRPVSDVYIKKSGAWQSSFHYDPVPPDPPEVDLQIVEEFETQAGHRVLKSRWLRVGVRLPGTFHDVNAKLIRVLTDYAGKPPTSPTGGTYTSKPDNNKTDEAWSDFWYNQDKGSKHSGHDDTSVLAYKQWPLNPVQGTIIKGATWYHFGAWSQNSPPNWSIATQASIYVPKDTTDAPNVIHKEATFQANNSGSWKAEGYVAGDLLQQHSPHSVGVWMHGAQFSDSIGSQGPADIISAQIWIRRDDDDGGEPNANIYLGWTPYATVASLPAPGDLLVKHEVTKIGTLAKGQGAWFSVPKTFWPDLAANIKGFALDNQDPDRVDALPQDFSKIVSMTRNLRCGQVHVVWSEQL